MQYTFLIAVMLLTITLIRSVFLEHWDVVAVFAFTIFVIEFTRSVDEGISGIIEDPSE